MDRIKVYYCPDCMWALQVGFDDAISNSCDNCGRHGLMFLIGTYMEVSDRFDELLSHYSNIVIKRS